MAPATAAELSLLRPRTCEAEESQRVFANSHSPAWHFSALRFFLVALLLQMAASMTQERLEPGQATAAAEAVRVLATAAWAAAWCRFSTGAEFDDSLRLANDFLHQVL
eukprot:gb/GFBE01065890.1/.p1 GENE.gb/GFBE01065890.1/~~gb/GFBE01065890.1/.p1  ORF type:complete len:108 (+),score=22.13 gb/GFBE01065890.1/:1-324(+)